MKEKFKHYVRFVAFVIFSIALTGCGNQYQVGKSFKIVTTNYPMYILALNLTDGADVSVENLNAGSDGCGHDAQLTTSDMQNIELANIIITNGAGLEPYTDELNNVKNKNNEKPAIIDSSEGLNLQRDYFDNSKYNPHVWLSVDNYIAQIDNISKKLKELDPKNRDLYQHNAYYYKKKVSELKAEFSSLFDSKEENLNVVCIHDFFAYFNTSLNINTAHVIEIDSHNSVPLQQVKDTIESMKKHDIKIIFVDSQQAENSTVKMIADETNSKIIVFDTNTCGEDDKNSYLKAMRKNFEAIKSIYEDV